MKIRTTVEVYACCIEIIVWIHPLTSLAALRSTSSAANIRKIDKIDDEQVAAGSFAANASCQKYRDFCQSVCVC